MANRSYLVCLTLAFIGWGCGEGPADDSSVRSSIRSDSVYFKGPNAGHSEGGQAAIEVSLLNSSTEEIRFDSVLFLVDSVWTEEYAPPSEEDDDQRTKVYVVDNQTPLFAIEGLSNPDSFYALTNLRIAAYPSHRSMAQIVPPNDSVSYRPILLYRAWMPLDNHLVRLAAHLEAWSGTEHLSSEQVRVSFNGIGALDSDLKRIN